MRTLYFEGAGWSGADTSKMTDMNNCRVRTAFTNDEGKKIYLEICASVPGKHSADRVKNFEVAGWIDSCHYITGGDNDENENVIYHRNYTVIEYNTASVLNFVNSLGCSFDAVETVPDLGGYRVFKETYVKGGEKYNYGDEFEFDEKLTAARENVHDHYDCVEKSEGKKFPNFSLWVDEHDKYVMHLLRHFNGYNKHWEIRIDPIFYEAIAKEKTLGKFAC